MVPNNVHLSSMFGDTQRMVLHPRTASNVSQHQDLDGHFGTRGSSLSLTMLWDVLRRQQQYQKGECRGGIKGNANKVLDHGGKFSSLHAILIDRGQTHHQVPVLASSVNPPLLAVIVIVLLSRCRCSSSPLPTSRARPLVANGLELLSPDVSHFSHLSLSRPVLSLSPSRFLLQLGIPTAMPFPCSQPPGWS